MSGLLLGEAVDEMIKYHVTLMTTGQFTTSSHKTVSTGTVEFQPSNCREWQKISRTNPDCEGAAVSHTLCSQAKRNYIPDLRIESKFQAPAELSLSGSKHTLILPRSPGPDLYISLFHVCLLQLCSACFALNTKAIWLKEHGRDQR